MQKSMHGDGVFAPMTTIKITAAAFIASLAIATTAQAAPIKPVATGNAKQDSYCKGAADLINDANDEASHASGDEESEWRDLAAEFKARSEANGCTFTYAVKRRPASPVAKSATATRAAR